MSQASNNVVENGQHGFDGVQIASDSKRNAHKHLWGASAWVWFDLVALALVLYAEIAQPTNPDAPQGYDFTPLWYWGIAFIVISIGAFNHMIMFVHYKYHVKAKFTGLTQVMFVLGLISSIPVSSVVIVFFTILML